jgi:hypothetical protein
MKDQEAKERMKAWKALPKEGVYRRMRTADRLISWEDFKREWQMMTPEQRKGK